MSAYTVSVSDLIELVEIPVMITTFGSLSRDAFVVLQRSENGPALNNSINGLSATHNLQIPGSINLDCKMLMIIVTMTTNDPLVELKGNPSASITIVNNSRTAGIITAIENGCMDAVCNILYMLNFSGDYWL